MPDTNAPSIHALLFNMRSPAGGRRRPARATGAGRVQGVVRQLLRRMKQALPRLRARPSEESHERLAARSFGAMSDHQLSDILGRDLAIGSARHRDPRNTDKWRFARPMPM